MCVLFLPILCGQLQSWPPEETKALSVRSEDESACRQTGEVPPGRGKRDGATNIL